MDEINEFLHLSKPFKRLTLPVGANNGRVVPQLLCEKKTERRPEIGTEYAAEYINLERNKSLQVNACFEDDDEFEPDPVYLKYSFQHFPENADLPIFDTQETILNALKENQVIVIDGSTGCGKSTQVPQFIIDDALERHQPVNIVVTQPRRIGARTLADRVSRERKWEMGTLVGYQIALDNTHSSEDTRILYCTTGVLLERLIQSKSLAEYSHIILDEVHERSKEMDFLFIIIRKLMSSQRVKTKIILMSATIEAEKFSNYFEMPQRNIMVPAPVIRVEKKSNFTVKNFYLEDLTKLNSKPKIDYYKPSISDDLYNIALRIIVVLKSFANDVIIGNKGEEMLSTILVFLPGINEITKMHDILTDYMNANSGIEWNIIVLHSSIGAEQQLEIFRNSGPNIRKIILSTNIAESSITVPDVVYVIDFCLSKYLVSNSATNFTSLQLCWASKNNCRQRSGRAGRVRNGRCYRMIHRSYFNKCMDESATPELIRTPLENIVLKTKFFNMGPPHSLLALAMDTPKLSDIANTILLLKEMGALLPTVNSEKTDLDGDITFIGSVMSELPLDVRISKLIILGYCLGHLFECIIIGCGLSVQNVFLSSFKHDLFPYSCKLEWANGSGSDLIALFNMFQVWSENLKQKTYRTSSERKIKEQQFGQHHAINIRALHEVSLLVDEVEKRLTTMNIKEHTDVRNIWKQHERSLIMKIIIAGAFYPNFFLRTSMGGNQDEHTAYQCLNGRDPQNTVYFSGFEPKYIRKLYENSIKDLMVGYVFDESSRKNVKVLFDRNTEKVFITFHGEAETQYNDTERQDWNTHRVSIPGRIVTEVYKAVKMRMVNRNVTIRVIGKPQKEMIEAQKHNLGQIEDYVFVAKPKKLREVRKSCLPRPLDRRIAGIVTYVESPERFWFQPISEEIEIKRICEGLNPIHSSQLAQRIPSGDLITIGQLVAIPRYNVFSRGKVISIQADTKVEVEFIDYGGRGECSVNNIYLLKDKTFVATLPPRCYECCLVKIQPSAMASATSDWSIEAINLFQELTIDNCSSPDIAIEPYSVVNNVTRVALFVGQINVNTKLLEKQYAAHAEENYMSKQNHAFRLSQQQSNGMRSHNTIDITNDGLDDLAYIDDGATSAPPTPRGAMCDQLVKLRGPFSPLERDIRSVMNSGLVKTVKVAAESVNSVILETNPQDCFQKYVVAAGMQEGDGSQSNLIIRNTTLMPNIPGFGAFMAMIFAPKMDIMRDNDKSRYISILTGLGYDEVKRAPAFDEHDCIIPLDVILSMDDISWVNQIRYCLDSLLYISPGSRVPEFVRNTDKMEIIRKIRDLFIKLLATERKFMEIHAVNHKWNQFDPKDLKMPRDFYADRAIFPMHSTLQLQKPSEEKIANLRKHCNVLRSIARTDALPSRPITCLLCVQEFDSILQLRLHMFSRLHLDREKQVNFESTED